MGSKAQEAHDTVSISSLLKTLRPLSVTAPSVDPDHVALAISHIFANQLTDVQACIFLHDLFITNLDQNPQILAKSASAMRAAAAPIDLLELERIMKERVRRRIGTYQGGPCDIVGTGGDGYSTFNISTASSILASSLLFIAKHGNRASTSKSGSADVLESMRLSDETHNSGSQLRVMLDNVTPSTLASIYSRTNYAFLYAHTFHPWVKNAAHIRRQLDHPTIFNLVGPLANPVHALLEARVIGVRKKDLVPVFVEALRLKGVKKAMVVCGDEDLDEISCAGPTHCARLTSKPAPNGAPPPSNGIVAPQDTADASNVLPPGALTPSAGGTGGVTHAPDARTGIEYFTLTPEDFGLPRHALAEVSPGMTPAENAAIMHRLLAGHMASDDPILHFVLLNTAALFVVAGACDGDTGDGDPFAGAPNADAVAGDQVITEVGPGGGRWKEGVRLARRAISSGRALGALREFMAATNEIAP